MTLSTRGGALPVTVRMTALPGGASVDLTAAVFDSNTAGFQGLTSGNAYTLFRRHLQRLWVQ